MTKLPRTIPLEKAVQDFGFKLLSADPELSLYDVVRGNWRFVYVQRASHLEYFDKWRIDKKPENG